MATVNYATLIPNNVNLSTDRRLQRALEKWHPKFLNWWLHRGPKDFQTFEVYLRTAVGVDRGNWAKFGFVRMPDYRWGILLAPAVEDRKIPFGEHTGEPVWHDVPGEYRALIRRLLVIQGDTEPASVEQQRFLGHTAPSLYDMRNLFQVNVEEARHLWAMVYLLHKYFGRDGREEADSLLERTSGDEDTPRILGAFNEETPDWLSFFLFTSFTDRDGKMQLECLAQSGFDPLSRTCRFMLTEEAHHMFVGKSGVERILKRTCQAMNDAGISDPTDEGAIRALGVMDLPTIQRKMNFHFSVTLDLFGSEISTNAANAFTAGIKGRFHEIDIADDHQLLNDSYPLLQHLDGKFVTNQVPAISAINARLVDDYITDCENIVSAWNKTIARSNIEFALSLPHRGFNRQIGSFADLNVTPEGIILNDADWAVAVVDYLPSKEDLTYILSLMDANLTAGEYASWIAPPKNGVGGKPGDFEYVLIDR
ncbi:MAG: benzoyl-CoA 2,3-epoxidase subunit BoxB [Gammaproteobacteria bacterium]|nr:MAG: benzoyl-CoA 2,3-epoxidase subunit BoxB [Gammaproteobacteria bacterium]